MRSKNWLRDGCVAASLALFGTPAFGAATIVILNNNAAGVGFNDPTPVAPVGGNPGTTLGQQRLNAFVYAANIWGATLTSVTTITIRAQFTPLTCTATSAVLGSAGPISVQANFPGALAANSWYHAALANKLAGADLDPANPEINANFNSNLGNAGCLTGTFFYLGLDANHGTNVDLVAVLLHEFGHGLGFSTVTSGTTGAFLSGLPSIFDSFLFDATANKVWRDMTATERVASAINTGKLAWSGPIVTNAVPTVLGQGAPRVVVTSPSTVANSYLAGTAGFGPILTNTGVIGNVFPVVSMGTGPGCDPFTGSNLGVAGKIALIDRGVCGFAVKAKNAQNAGAIGVIIANNAAGAAPGLGGSDPTVVIPTMSLSQTDGATLRTAVNTRSRTSPPVTARLGLDSSVGGFIGADSAGRALMYAPNPFQSGSSVSHYDTSMYRNQLMEPAINGDLTHSVVPPQDLTFKLLQDIGW